LAAVAAEVKSILVNFSPEFKVVVEKNVEFVAFKLLIEKLVAVALVKIELVAVRLEIVVVANVDIPLAIKVLVAVIFPEMRLVPVALVNSKSAIDARIDLKNPVTSMLVAVVVAVSFREFSSVIVVVESLLFTVEDMRLSPVDVE
jgi:hypothetical protein